MLRKFFRRYLPSHTKVRASRHVARFGAWLQHHNLWHLHRRSVAGGVAAGMFAGLIPGSNPVQFTVAALLAIAFRVNLPIAVAVTLYSNPFTIVPLYYLAYKLGQLALFDAGEKTLPAFLPAFDFEGRAMNEWLDAAIAWLGSVGKPLLVGLPLLAILLSAVSYFVVRGAWRWQVVRAWRRRQLRMNRTL